MQKEDLNVLQSYSDDYLEIDKTPFKCKLIVSDTQAEIDFYKKYLEHVEAEKKRIDPESQQQTTNQTNVFGWPTSGTGFGTTPTFGTQSFGGTSNSKDKSSTTNQQSNPFGNNPFNPGNQGFGMTGNSQIQQNALPDGMKQIGNNKCEIQIYFFDGLQQRLEYQEQQQKEMKEKLETIMKTIKKLMEEIQTEILNKFDSLQKTAIEIDKKIIAKLCESQNVDPIVIAKFRDLNGKIEINDVKSKTDQLLTILQNKKMDENQQQILDDETKTELFTLLSKQQELILKFVGEVNNLQGKYQQLKSTLDSLNDKY